MRSFLVFVAALAAVSACARGGQTPSDGAAADSTSHICRTARVCVGTTVHACRGGEAAEAVEECAPERVCSLGRCTSRACQSEEQKQGSSFAGCLFYALNVDNVASDEGAPSSVLVTNPNDAVATVELRGRQMGASGWSSIKPYAVSPFGVVRVVLPGFHFEGGGFARFLEEGAAVQLASNLPVTATQMESDDSDADDSAGSTGGTVLMPVHVLGLRYLAVTYPQAATRKVADTSGSRGGAGQVIIVGTEDNTKVTFTVSARGSIGMEGQTPPRGPGEAFDFILSEGEIQQIFSAKEGDDLTGSAIDADRPVAVFSGNISTTYGREAPLGINSPDMANEQLLPLALLGTDYVAAALPPQPDTCDGVFGVRDASLFRVVGTRNGTQVKLEAPPGVSGLPASPFMIDRGQVRDMIVAGGSFHVTASMPVMVTQGIDCEPTLASAVPTGELLRDLWFAVLPRFDQMLGIVRHPGVAVMLDGVRVDDLDVSFAPAGADFEVAQVTLPPCPVSVGVCPHHLTGEFGMTLRGMAVLASYALTAPTWICDAETGCVD